MQRPPSRFFIIWSIIRKDFFEIARDRLWIYLSVLSLVLYALVYWILPSAVDETIKIAVYQRGLNEIVKQYTQEDGFEMVEFGSPDEVKDVVAGKKEVDEEINIGIVFPDDFLQKTIVGERATVRLYADTSVPEEISRALSAFVRETALGVQVLARDRVDPEEALPVKFPEEETMVLGEDRAGDQIPLREKIIPLFVFFVLMVESMALASLIATEIQSRTILPVLTTPTKTSDFLLAKVIFGTFLALSQAVIILLLLGAFFQNTFLVLTILLLGAMMVTGIALISGSAGKDFMGTLFYSMAFMIPIMIPAFVAFFPGTASAWVKIIPTYGLVEGIMRSIVYTEGWLAVSSYLGMLVAWNIAIFGGGLLILKRRIEAL